MVLSTVPKGRITVVDGPAIRRMPGVMVVMTRQNVPRLPTPKEQGNTGGKEQSKLDNKPQPRSPKLSLLQDDYVEYNAQPIAVVAETFEHVRDAARRLPAKYAAAPAQPDFQQAALRTRRPEPQPERPPETSRGNAVRGLQTSQRLATLDVGVPTYMRRRADRAAVLRWNRR